MTAADNRNFLEAHRDELRKEAARLKRNARELEMEAYRLEQAGEAIDWALEMCRIASETARQVPDDWKEAAALVCPEKLGPKHKRLLGAMRDRARGGLVDVSFDELKGATGLGMEGVKACLAAVEMMGFIQTIRVARGGGKPRYRLLRAGFDLPGTETTGEARAT